MIPLVLLGIGLLAVVALVVGRDDSPSSASVDQVTAVAVTGATLPPAPRQGLDPGVGLPAPTASGQDFAGRPLQVVPANGRPTAIMFLAHWCPSCQADVKEVAAWISASGMPEGVTLRAVSTWVDPRRPNYPPSQWLERERWQIPTLVDDERSSVARAFGLEYTPYWVFLDGSGRVTKRVVGRMPMEMLRATLADLALGRRAD